MGCCWPTPYIQEKQGTFPTINHNVKGDNQSDKKERQAENQESQESQDDITMDDIIVAYQQTHPGTFQETVSAIKRQNHIRF